MTSGHGGVSHARIEKVLCNTKMTAEVYQVFLNIEFIDSRRLAQGNTGRVFQAHCRLTQGDMEAQESKAELTQNMACTGVGGGGGLGRLAGTPGGSYGCQVFSI